MCVLTARHSVCSNGTYENDLLPKRVLTKKGQRNIKHISVPRKSIKFVKDLTNTLIEMSWCKTINIFLISYFTSVSPSFLRLSVSYRFLLNFFSGPSTPFCII